MATWRISKEFKLPIGHRLSCHPGLCANFHGHNIRIIVGLKSKKLNENGMIMDFSTLKKKVSPILDELDHALILNKNDVKLFNTIEGENYFNRNFKTISLPFEPTAENLSRYLYFKIYFLLEGDGGLLEYVEVWENDSAMARFED